MLKLSVDVLPRAEAHDVAVVIDVLRMTSTASVLFARGLTKLWVIAEVEAARALAAKEKALLLGERNNVALPGFDGGNSPLEYEAHDLSARTAVLCTSNGSRAVEAAAAARHLLLGAVVNARAVAARALALAKEEILLVCAGTEGQLSLDDLVGAGCIARELLKLEPELALDDGARLVLKLKDLRRELAESRHGRLLIDSGFSGDLDFAARLNSLEAVPERIAASPAVFGWLR